MKYLILATLLGGWLAVPVGAQKTVRTDRQLWLAAFSQVRVTDRFGLWFDGHLRLRNEFAGDWSQSIARVGLTYYYHDDVRLTAGYAYVHHFPGEGHARVDQPEHRPWQQIQWFARFPGLRFMQWVRLEERFRRKVLNDDALADGYRFNYRLRYNLACFLPLGKNGFAPGGWQLLVNNEAHFNFGKEIVYNYFDQNRFFAGLVYQATAHSQVHAGYMNIYQQLASGTTFNSLHCIRLFYFHNFDLRKK